MSQAFRFILVAILPLVLPATALAANETTVQDLVENGVEFDDQQVSVRGELVGDYGFRSDGWMWVQLNGDSYVEAPLREEGSAVGGNTGIGIRMPVELASDLDPPGRYRNRGPVVLLVGTWKYHDIERQGESYLEVESFTVIEPGRPLEQGPNWLVIVAGVVLIGVAALAWRLQPEE
jgi:hypothetical protein